jgi:hypothetical protein
VQVVLWLKIAFIGLSSFHCFKGGNYTDYNGPLRWPRGLFLCRPRPLLSSIQSYSEPTAVLTWHVQIEDSIQPEKKKVYIYALYYGLMAFINIIDIFSWNNNSCLKYVILLNYVVLQRSWYCSPTIWVFLIVEELM